MRLALQITRSIAAVAWILIMLIPVSVPHFLGLRRLNGHALRIWFAGVYMIMGVKISLHGECSRARPLLFVSNHTSYIDVFILGGLLPMSFTPKSETASWPVIGFLCKIAGCLFIDRRPRAIQTHQKELSAALKQGRRICLFPEGTTGLGDHVLPFRAGLLSIAEKEAAPTLTVQPVTLVYTQLEGKTLTPQTRPNIAWVGDDALIPHLWKAFGYRSMAVEVHFLEPLSQMQRLARKDIAQHAQAAISQRLNTRFDTLQLPTSS